MGSLWSYFLESIGFSAFEDMRAGLFGLSNAGKSVLANALKTGEYKEIPPTVGIDEISNVNLQTEHDKKSLQIFDISGDEKMRQEWQQEALLADLVLFAVDGSDMESVKEAVQALDDFVSELPFTKPVFVVMTKLDLAEKGAYVRFDQFQSLLTTNHPLIGMEVSSKTKTNLKELVEKLVAFCKEAKRKR
uniref:Uncharacterized protein n=1 Tax=Percolomonas cosmopolitus TaxID=63605 RepID=A0A7S1PH82_9EUKA|mmetsp:Transcript_3941/g.14914  ORF Transcript_3941/g.14914 Transcript_3941/m.14914 type:complete len:190 (+) Transcript_3941:179-748(+)|eukprot:CAMPEP_0117446812 /NCGR_PEP_ID=MMETSP0759-20121206/6543_1 /TAXON_ID=63605 /ORGANISM="Percolomonas cosmopolitus, Strain WS" /LENGTH=189 /DNA_ID=CAMNT_0005239109 /DNA_START=155 /DNA_END=724 /DNA_ORIENTATION=-